MPITGNGSGSMSCATVPIKASTLVSVDAAGDVQRMSHSAPPVLRYASLQLSRPALAVNSAVNSRSRRPAHGGERGPRNRGEHQCRAGGFLGVPHGAVRVEVGHLDTIATVAVAVAGLAPLGAGQVGSTGGASGLRQTSGNVRIQAWSCERYEAGSRSSSARSLASRPRRVWASQPCASLASPYSSCQFHHSYAGVWG
jgi:hypothetical protein